MLESPVGAGGMGQVFRALDRQSGQVVAVKIMLDADPGSTMSARFAAEISALAELSHDGIVGYVAHGATTDGRPYLAMEYLDGEDLAARLLRGPLSLSETLALARGVSAALEVAHRRGIVHRDLKPSNVFVRDGDATRPSLLDFGIARRAMAGPGLTRTGMIVGTPEYMAPEQAQGRPDVGPAADVFALGCVVYHCLAGRSPFAAEHVVATLGKIVFEEPPSLVAMRPDLPVQWQALIARMLEKSPKNRLRDGGEVRAALDALEAPDHRESPTQVAAGLGRHELELVSVIVVAPPRAGASDATLAESHLASDADRVVSIQAALSSAGIPSQRLADGSIVATLAQQGGSAMDQATLAAIAARGAQARWPGATVAVATARGMLGAGVPVGEALDRAARLLGDATTTPGVRLDDVTAGLLGGRLRTVVSPGAPITLHEGPLVVDEGRRLLGKATPCVGREQELGMLELGMRGAFEEPSARAMLVLAEPGMGKSRLRHELLRRVDRADEDAQTPVLRLEARGELLRAGSPHGLVGQVLRSLFGVEPSGDPGVARARLVDGVARFVTESEAPAIAELLGELCDVPFPDDDSVRLRAARQDPRLMQAWLGEALVSLLRGATGKGPVLLTIEDLHWGDRPSMDLVDLALRQLEDRPLFVVAFARPELKDLAPDLWKGRVVELPLRPLSRRACERLVQRVAGDRLDAATIARIAEQSDGNALFLEELLRASCEADGAELPGTVVAMLQARIGRLGSGERRALRAASVYGERFSREALSAVLGPAVSADEVSSWLASLEHHEILEAPRDGSEVHRFRHALMREAAYGLLPEDDRRVGHLLAARWLAGHEHDPALVGEHFLLANAPDEAAPWFLRAAVRAHERDDYAGCERMARRCREAGASGEAMGSLGALEGFSAIMRWDWDRAAIVVDEALPWLPAGSVFWCYAQRVVTQLAAFRNDPERLRATVGLYLSTPPSVDAELVYGDTALHMASAVTQVGIPELARALLGTVDEVLGASFAAYPALHAWRNVIGATYQRHTADDLAVQLALLDEAVRAYEEVGASATMIVLSRDVLGEVECRAGLRESGEARLRGSLADASRLGTAFLLAHSRLSLANGLLSAADDRLRDESVALAREILAMPRISAGYQAMARDVLAHVHVTRGQLADAEREAREAIALSPHTPVRRWLMVAHLTLALTRTGRWDEARATAVEALREMDETGLGGGYAELPLVLAAAEASRDAGLADESAVLVARARRRCLEQRASFDDEDARARFTLHLASRTTKVFPMLAPLDDPPA